MSSGSRNRLGLYLSVFIGPIAFLLIGAHGCGQKRLVSETKIDQHAKVNQERVMTQKLSEHAQVLFLGGQAGTWSVNVEVARSPSQRARGLMGRKKLADDQGMLFVFDRLDRHSFYMKNTLIPLDIVFLSGDRGEVSVVGVLKDMRPFDEKPRSIDALSLAAVELRSPLADQRSIKVGDKVVIELENP